jgi:hypothetical protein
MSKALFIAGALVAASSGTALAQQTFSAWGHDFTVSNFAPQQMMVGVATDRATGRKFNVIKLRNGTMMAVVPMSSMKRMPATAARHMIR